jgi:predicted phage terminase large subunit-like protein
LALIECLEKVSRGEIDRLLVCMPPGSGKSTYSSVLFPAWFLSNHPTASVIAASHTAELSEKWGRRVRNSIIESAPTLGISLSSDSQAAGRWRLQSGGEYWAVGVGGAVLGFRADLAVVDDPVRSREDAQSETIRRTIRDWYLTDLKTRLRPGGRIVLVSTRFHEADLAGSILEDMAKPGGDQWHSLILPAQAEDNDPLGRAPETFLWDDDPSYEYGRFLRREQQTQPPWNWSALYQQKPAPESGDYFQASWLRSYDAMPSLSSMRVFAASDFAVTQGAGDFTVHLICGVDPSNKLYLLDMYRAQAAPDRWIEEMLRLAKLWKPVFWGVEKGQILSSVGPLLDRRMQETRTFIATKPFTSKADKPTRAQAIRGWAALNGLYCPMKAPWWSAMQTELLQFPVSRTDDCVDALSLVGRMLDVMQPQPKAVEEKKTGGPYGIADASYALFRDPGQLDRFLSGDDMIDHGDGYTSIATL